MLVTGEFVFIHLHKSGGSFLNQLIRSHFPAAREIGYHWPLAELPGRYCDLPVLGVIRNPWDYYVSWYSFQAGMQRPGPLFRRMSRRRQLDFAGTVRNLVELSRPGNEDLPGLIERFPRQRPGRGLNLSAADLEPLRASGLGFYSFLFQRMYGTGDGVHFIRMESLRQGLLDALEGIGLSPSDELVADIRQRPPRNTSEHRHYSHYYDDALRELVAQRDGELINRFGYRFTAE